jgi:hypothetical protein
MQAAISILLVYYILRHPYPEGSIFSFLRELYRVPVCLVDFKDYFNTL